MENLSILYSIILKSCCRKKCRVAILFTVINCALIYYMVSSHSLFSRNNSSSEINSFVLIFFFIWFYDKNDLNRKRLFDRPMNSSYDYYFRIEYTILDSPCQPLNTFQTIEALDSLEQMVKRNYFLFIYFSNFVDKWKNQWNSKWWFNIKSSNYENQCNTSTFESI